MLALVLVDSSALVEPNANILQHKPSKGTMANVIESAHKRYFIPINGSVLSNGAVHGLLDLLCLDDLVVERDDVHQAVDSKPQGDILVNKGADNNSWGVVGTYLWFEGMVSLSRAFSTFSSSRPSIVYSR